MRMVAPRRWRCYVLLSGASRNQTHRPHVLMALVSRPVPWSVAAAPGCSCELNSRAPPSQTQAQGRDTDESIGRRQLQLLRLFDRSAWRLLSHRCRYLADILVWNTTLRLNATATIDCMLPTNQIALIHWCCSSCAVAGTVVVLPRSPSAAITGALKVANATCNLSSMSANTDAQMHALRPPCPPIEHIAPNPSSRSTPLDILT